MVNELQIAFNEIAEERALPKDVIIEALENALVSAYRKDSNASQGQSIEARIDPDTGRVRIFVEKEVTDEIISPATEVTLEKARYYEPEAQLGDTVMVQVEHTTKQFGRIAAQTAKQVILQKIREAERKQLYDEFVVRQGELVMATVQNANSRQVTLSLGRAEAIMPSSQQIPRERYRQHEKVKVYILEVKQSPKGPQIICSRSHRNVLRRLVETEVPEIYNGQVEIKSIAREAGYRSKIAVAALQEGIDPVGACVGMRGIRIQNIVKELNDEKIDVIEWNPDPKIFISKALSPARVTGVYLEDDPHTGRTAVVVVPDDQLSLAIGREGQNARLAAKLTGWRIDIKSVSETVQSALENIDMPPIDGIAAENPVLVSDVQTILDKKTEGRTIMPEEYTTLARFADIVETALLEVREELRQEELERINAVKATLPEPLFSVPVDALALPEDIIDALQPLDTVGDVLLSTLIDETRVEQLVSQISPSAMDEVQNALNILMESDIDYEELIPEEEPEEAAEEAEEIVAEAVEEVEEPAAEVEVETATEPAEEAEVEKTEAADTEEEVVYDAFGGVLGDEEDDEPEVPEEEVDATGDDSEIPAYNEAVEDDPFDNVDYDRMRKKGKSKRRRLVYDEESGEVVSKRRRKGNRRRNEWEDF